MAWTRRFWLKLQTLFRRNRNAQQLNDEIQFHIDQQIAENIAAGMSPGDARYAALRTFGNPTVLKEEARDTWGWLWLEQIAQDVRYSLRQLGRSPGFTLAVILSLALGIGANTAIFSLIDAVMLKMLPVKSPERLVLLNWVCPQTTSRRWIQQLRVLLVGGVPLPYRRARRRARGLFFLAPVFRAPSFSSAGLFSINSFCRQSGHPPG